MKLSSPVIEHNGKTPSVYTCDGSDTSPPLLIEDVPEDTQSLVLIMEDPDVPPEVREDRVWDHWIIFNISPDTREIKEGVEPEGVHGVGTNGDTKYHGPCPPDREHRYIFKLFAVDTTLDLPEGSSKAEILKATKGHITDQAELIGRYERLPHA